MNSKKDIGLLILRIIVGGLFIFAGVMKVKDMGQTLVMFDAMHIPAFLTYIVAYGEVVFGILLVLGVLWLLSALFLSVVMVVAVCLTIPLGVSMFAFPLVMLLLLVLLIKKGPGRFRLGPKFQ